MAVGTETLRAVSDELAIRTLVATLAQLADHGPDDLTEYLSCFTEDAVWESRIPPKLGANLQLPRRGHAAIREGAEQRRGAGMQGPASRTLHVVGTTVVRLAGDSARATSHFLALHQTDTAPEILIAGIYQDAFRRMDAGWKLAHRILLPK